MQTIRFKAINKETGKTYNPILYCGHIFRTDYDYEANIFHDEDDLIVNISGYYSTERIYETIRYVDEDSTNNK